MATNSLVPPIPASSLSHPLYLIYNSFCQININAKDFNPESLLVLPPPYLTDRALTIIYKARNSLDVALRNLYFTPEGSRAQPGDYSCTRLIPYPQLYETLECYLAFFFETLCPAMERCEINPSDKDEDGVPLWLEEYGYGRDTDITTGVYFRLVAWVCGEYLVKRYRARLLREGQVGIVVTVLRRLMERLAAICEVVEVCEVKERRCEKCLWWRLKIYREIDRMYGLLKVVVSDRFRSERLEVLLERHLSDDAGEAGEVVARKLEEINWRSEGWRRMTPEGFR